MEIGKHIQYFRKQLEYSQKELADFIYVSESTIGHYETGTRLPPADKIQLLAEALEVEVQDLFYGNTKKESEWEWYYSRELDHRHLKNINEKRFKMMMKRVHGCISEEINENEEIIEAKGYLYSKSLASRLLSMAKNGLLLTTIHYHPKYGWEIEGYIHEECFQIRFKGSNSSRFFTIQVFEFDTIYPNSAEIKELIYRTMNWLLECNSQIIFDYSLGALKYIVGNEQKPLLTHSLYPLLSSSHYMARAVRNHTTYKTIGDLLSSKEEDYLINPTIKEEDIQIIQRFQKLVKESLEPQIFYVYCKEKDEKEKTSE